MLKRSVFAVLVCLAGSPVCLHAQTPLAGNTFQWQTPLKDTVIWHNSISILPFSLLGSGLELAYEHFLPASRESVHINVGYFVATNPYFYDNYNLFSGFRAELQYRFHLLKTPYQRTGFYVAPYAQVKSISLTKNEDPGDPPFIPFSPKKIDEAMALGLGVVFGYQQRYASRLVVDFYLGGGLIVPATGNTEQVDISILNPYNRGIAVHGGCGIGLLPKKRARP